MPVRFTECKAIWDSGKALKVIIPDLGETKWVPHSQIHDDSEVYRVDDEGDLVVSDWLAGKWGVV